VDAPLYGSREDVGGEVLGLSARTSLSRKSHLTPGREGVEQAPSCYGLGFAHTREVG